jgi:hypothetical protein
MGAIEFLQKIREESEQLFGQLDSGSSRIYEISTAGTIVERTQQLRSFYELVGRQLEQAIRALGGGTGYI